MGGFLTISFKDSIYCSIDFKNPIGNILWNPSTSLTFQNPHCSSPFAVFKKLKLFMLILKFTQNTFHPDLKEKLLVYCSLSFRKKLISNFLKQPRGRWTQCLLERCWAWFRQDECSPSSQPSQTHWIMLFCDLFLKYNLCGAKHGRSLSSQFKGVSRTWTFHQLLFPPSLSAPQ